MGLDYQEHEETSEDVKQVEEPQTGQSVEPVIPVYSIILIASIIIVWLFQIGFASLESPIRVFERFVAVAGLVKPLFWYGECWRLLTAGTLHAGIMHIAFNSYALYILGKPVEFLSNRSHLAIVFILSVIGGGLLSVIFLPNIPSVGASGGIVGFLGYLTAYGFKRRKLLPPSFLKNMLFNIGFIAIFGIFIIPNVDNFGHLGGFLVGIIYGFIQIPTDHYKDPRETSKIIDVLGYIALGIFILTCVFTILLLTNVISFDYSFVR